MPARMSHLKIERKLTNAFIRQAQRAFHEDHPRYVPATKQPKRKIGVQRGKVGRPKKSKKEKLVVRKSEIDPATFTGDKRVVLVNEGHATYDIAIGLAIDVAAGQKIESEEILAMIEQAREAARSPFNSDKRIASVASTARIVK